MDSGLEKSEGKSLQIKILVVSLPSALKNTTVLQNAGCRLWTTSLVKTAESFCWFDKGYYLCIPNRNKPLVDSRVGAAGNCRKIFERMETTAHKFSIYGKVMLAKEIDNMTSNFERKLIVSIKTHLQWRVWSWLRMNASGRLNTCKSRGSTGSNTGWRPANGCGTRTQLTSN